MASFNVTVEDSSPLITYAPAGSWTDTPANDPLVASYSGGSYHIAAAQGATATITFTGTGLSIFGGHRSNYGTYTVTVDGQTITSGTAQASDNSTRQLLGASSGLSYGSHTAILASTGGGPIDIDWIDFEAQVGQPGSVGVQRTFDDNDSTITYSPSSSWQTNSGSAFFDGTLHFSQSSNASASLTFSGDAVAVYGTVASNHANTQIVLDDNSQVMPGGSGGMTSTLHTQVLLYYRSDLGPGQHTLTLSGNSQTTAAPYIDLDYINVFDAAQSPDASSSAFIPSSTGAAENTLVAAPSSSPTSSHSSASPLSSSRVATGTMVGAILGGSIAFLLLLAILVFLFLRRRRTGSKAIEKSMISVSPILPMQRDPKALEAGIGALENPVFPLPPKASMRHSIAPSYYSDPEYVTHSRNGSTMSSQSSTPLVPFVPILNVPQARFISRKPAPASSGFDVKGTPARPSNRPPTMDFGNMTPTLESYQG